VCVCAILCFLCIVVPLPPGTYPFTVNNNNNDDNNNNNNNNNNNHIELSIQISIKMLNFHTNPSSGSRVNPYGRTNEPIFRTRMRSGNTENASFEAAEV
jgi:hypothetical protein